MNAIPKEWVRNLRNYPRSKGTVQEGIPVACAVPFKQLLLAWRSGGDQLVITPCCDTWIQYDEPSEVLIREVIDDPFKHINTPYLVKFRQSILDGSYSFCHRGKCPFLMVGLQNFLSDEEHKGMLAAKGILKEIPTAYIGTDPSCNLACGSCRSDYQTKANDLTKPLILGLLEKGAKSLFMSTSGDPFYNRGIREIMQTLERGKYPLLEKVSLLTNGQLLNESMWESLSPHFKELLFEVQVSVDSITKETYETLRKGGSFERIQSNLSFLSSLKQRGLLKFFSLSFVIQDLNKWELPLLAEFAAQLKVDFVMFYKVTQWMDDESFKKIQLSPTFFSENMGLIAETKRILKENGIPYATSIPELVPV